MSTALQTSEVRWFADGPPPGSVRSWFTGPATVTEARCDLYLLRGVVTVGVKVRAGQTLELKVRRGAGTRVDLGHGMLGRLEEWRKWSPADDVVDIPARPRWTPVGKVVTRRRFSADGTEIAWSAEAVGAGCDVEVTHVTVDTVEAWTLAFAAFGPRSVRHAALRASWQTMTASGVVPRALTEGVGCSMGYPQWLSLTVTGAGIAAFDSSTDGSGESLGERAPSNGRPQDAASPGIE